MGCWIVLFTTCVHVWWGLYILLAYEQALEAQGGALWHVYYNIAPLWVWGLGMLLGSILALLALTRKPVDRLTMAMFFVQHLIVTIGAIGSLALILQGHDLVHQARAWRVFPVSISLFIFYSGSILTMNGEDNWTHCTSWLSRLRSRWVP